MRRRAWAMAARRGSLGIELPGAVDAEGREAFAFAVVERMLDDAIDAAAAGAALEAEAQIGEVGGIAGGDNFHVAVFSVAHPAFELELAGLTMHEPAKAHTLYAALNEEVKDHGHGQFCRWLRGGARVTGRKGGRGRGLGAAGACRRWAAGALEPEG